MAPATGLAQADKPLDFTGQWEMTAETPVGNFTSTMKIERKGDQFSGVTVGKDGKETPLNDVAVTGKTLTFTEDVSFNGENYHVVYSGTAEGDNIKGTFQSSGETMNWSARRLTTSAPAQVNVAGTWTISLDTPNGTRERTLVLKQTGSSLTGTITGPSDQPIALEGASLTGNELRFSVSVDRNGTSVKRVYTSKVEGDSLTGTIEGGSQTRSFSGKRQPAPSPVSSLAGTWKLAVQAPDRTYNPTISLAEQGGKWSGKLVDEQAHEAELKELMVNGNQLDFVADLERGGTIIHLKFSGSLEGEQLKGTMEANDNKLPTTGERTPKA
jgi:hypothetical protein